MHTPPIHYLIRIAHSERWSPSLYLNGKGLNLTQCEAPNQTFFFYCTDRPSTCLCAPLRIKSHRFNQQMSATSGKKKKSSPCLRAFPRRLRRLPPLTRSPTAAPIICSQVRRGVCDQIKEEKKTCTSVFLRWSDLQFGCWKRWVRATWFWPLFVADFFSFFLQGGHAGRVCFSLVIVAIPADAGAIPRKTPLWRWYRFVVLFSFVYFFMIEIRLKKMKM